MMRGKIETYLQIYCTSKDVALSHQYNISLPRNDCMFMLMYVIDRSISG